MKPLTVARSIAGRDAGEWFVVLEDEGEFALIANGKSRPLERQKRKRKKHLAMTAVSLSPEALRSNRALRIALSRFGDHDEGGK